MSAIPGCPARARLLALLTGAAVGCSGPAQKCLPCVEPAGTRGVELASVEAVVEEVQVGPPPGATPDTPEAERSFQLAAWYRDANDSIISGHFDPFEWTVVPSSSAMTEPFGQVRVRSYGSAPATLLVTSPDGRLQDQVALRRWTGQGEAAAGGDVVVAHHGADFPPSVVLVERSTAGVCSWDRAWAFVGIASVGQHDEQPCSLAVLSADRGMLFQAPVSDWTQAAQAAAPGAVVEANPPQPRELPITIFIAVTGRTASLLSGFDLTDTDQLAKDVAAGAMAQAKMDVTWANMLYEANRVGIRIKADYRSLPATPDLSERIGADDFSCAASRLNLVRPDPADPAADYEYDPNVLSVYYVDWIDFLGDPIHPGANGVECDYWYTGTPGPVILISYTKQSSLTLAHEIGHALGLPDEEGRLGGLNLMHNLLDDGPLAADARSRLTVGQVFRMNVATQSWITTRTGGGPTRLCWTTSPCPPIELDAR